MRKKSEKLFSRARARIPGGVNSPVRFYEPYPFFASKAGGSRIFDVDKNSYVDYCMGYGSLLLGHNFREVTDHVRTQLGKGSLFCTPSEGEVELAELISRCVPCAEMVRLVNTGAEATMHAIRLARGYTKRKKIIKFEGCYHGAYDYVLVKAGSGAMHQGLPLSEGMPDGVAENTIVLPYNDPAALEDALAKKNDGDDDIAAVIMEPVIANMGLIAPKAEFLDAVRKMTQQSGVLLIFDEVVTGFRLSLGGAQEYYNVLPDIATFAKAMSNGFPIAAIAGRREVMEQLSPVGRVYQASTFAGNPVSVAASLATLRTLARRKNVLYPRVERRCADIVSAVRDSLSSLKFAATVNCLGSMFQIFFTDGAVTDYESCGRSDAKLFKRFFDLLLREGIFVPPSQFETLFVSYSHSADDARQTIAAFEDALKKVVVATG